MANERTRSVLEALQRRLGDGSPVDSEFDDVYPPPIREVSSSFWTPVSVAMRGAALLVRDASTRVLDIGSGAGKFCIVGAAVTGVTFTGIEHRDHLVETARAAASRLGVSGATFLHGAFDRMDLTGFDAFYLFNPFEENVSDDEDQLDESVELSPARFIADVEYTERFLAGARIGTRVLTDNGFGGSMPRGYLRVLREYWYRGYLELWTKVTN